MKLAITILAVLLIIAGAVIGLLALANGNAMLAAINAVLIAGNMGTLWLARTLP